MSTPSKRTTTDDFFDRMSKTETFATSSQKAANRESPSSNKLHLVKRTPIKLTTTDSFFDRMSKAETYSTATLKGKLEATSLSNNDESRPSSSATKKKTTTNDFFDRMSKTETYSTATLKQKEVEMPRSLPKESVSLGGSSFSSESSPKSDKKTTNSFFDRMSNTETFATATLKGKIEASPPEKSSPTPPQKTTTIEFFHRMSKTETFSTATLKGKIMVGNE